MASIHIWAFLYTLMSETIIYGIHLWTILLEALQKLKSSPGTCAQVKTHRATKVNYAVQSPDEN